VFRPRQRARGSGIRNDRVLRSAVLGLLVYALGLIPFYLLTPAHLLVRDLVAPPRPPAGQTTLPAPTFSPTVPPPGTAVLGPDTVTPAPSALPSAGPATDQRYAFLLLGYGGGNHEGAYLTDSIMVVIVDPGQKILTLLSIPRDTWVPLSFDGRSVIYDKINTAYAYARDPTAYTDRLAIYTGDRGAGTFAMTTVQHLLGIPISYYLALDFDGFRQMINAVGGIDVDVPDSFTARYPVNDDPSVDPRWTVVRFVKGLQHMDGERAIEFARARETLDNPSEGSDFARSRRQRLIMEAFKERLLQPGALVHLPELLAIASRHVDTNYAIPAVAQIGQLVLDWKNVRFYQTALTTSNYLEEATGNVVWGPVPYAPYLLVPDSPDRSWARIRAFSRRLWEDPALGVAMASTRLVVENDSGEPGVAARLSQELAGLGYVVGPPVSGPTRAESRLIDRTGGAVAPLLHQLNRDLGLTLPIVMEDPGPDDPGGLVIEIGADHADLSLTVPSDPDAPSSAQGVQRFGSYVPYTPPTPTPVHPRGTPTRAATPASAQTALPLPSDTETPARSAPRTPTMTATPPAIITPVRPAVRPRRGSTPTRRGQTGR
jgi:LCP family protein required for cell wall assembly